MGSFDKSGKGVYSISIIPFPTQDDFLVWFEVSCSEYAKGKGIRIFAGTKNWTKDGVWPTTAAKETRIVACYTGVEGEVEGRTDEMNKRFWHSEMSVGVEGIGEV